MRRFLLIPVVVAAGLAVPMSTSAKGAAELTISGARLPRPVVVDYHGQLNSITEQTRFWDAVSRPPVSAVRTAPEAPTDDLGPRLVLSWDMHHDDGAPGEDVPIVQSLYPLAAGGPLVHTGPGQQLYGQPVGAAWLRADRDLLATLRELSAMPSFPARGTWFAT